MKFQISYLIQKFFLHCVLILNIIPVCLCRPIVVRFRRACERPGECCTTIYQTCALVRPVFIMRTKCQPGPHPVVIFWTLMDCCFTSRGNKNEKNFYRWFFVWLSHISNIRCGNIVCTVCISGRRQRFVLHRPGSIYIGQHLFFTKIKR